MKTILFLIFLSILTASYGQTYVFESDYKNFVNKNVRAHSNKFKSISVFIYKNGKAKNEKLYSKEMYDNYGKIISKLEHYNDYRYYKEISFYYDKNNSLTKILTKSNLSKDYFYITEIGYTQDIGKQPVYIMHKYTKHDNLKFDTLFYSYDRSGTLKYKYWSSKHDTIFYHYDKFGEIINTSANSKDTTDTRIIDKYGCYLGDKRDTIINGDKDDLYFKTTYTCDSLCNDLSSTEEMYKKGRWIVISKTENKFIGKTLVEEESCQCGRKFIDNCKGKLKFRYHTKYEYNDNGFLSKETDFNKRGKVIKVKKFVYETY